MHTAVTVCLCLHCYKHHWLSETQASFTTLTQIPHPTLLPPWSKISPQCCPISDLAVCLHGSNAEGTSCQLFWDGEHVLNMGWHHTIKVSCIDSHAFIGSTLLQPSFARPSASYTLLPMFAPQPNFLMHSQYGVLQHHHMPVWPHKCTVYALLLGTGSMQNSDAS